jgi:hypothetical protein
MRLGRGLSGTLDGKNGSKPSFACLRSTKQAFRSSPEIGGIARAKIAPGLGHLRAASIGSRWADWE